MIKSIGLIINIILLQTKLCKMNQNIVFWSTSSTPHLSAHWSMLCVLQILSLAEICSFSTDSSIAACVWSLPLACVLDINKFTIL